MRWLSARRVSRLAGIDATKAAQALGKTGTTQQGVVEALGQALDKRGIGLSGARALVSIGTPEANRRAVSGLVRLLRRREPLLDVCHAAKFLGRMGAKAEAAVPALSEMLEDPYPIVRRVAAEALRRIRQPPSRPSTMPTHDDRAAAA